MDRNPPTKTRKPETFGVDHQKYMIFHYGQETNKTKLRYTSQRAIYEVHNLFAGKKQLEQKKRKKLRNFLFRRKKGKRKFLHGKGLKLKPYYFF